MTLVPFIAISFLLPFGISVSGWPRADLDRFYFYGTAAGFFLAASCIDVVLSKRVLGGVSSAAVVLILSLFSASLTLGPVHFIVTRVTRQIALDASHRTEAQGSVSEGAASIQLQRSLARIGPREQIVTSVEMAQSLVRAGFVVQAPMSSHRVAAVEAAGFDEYSRRHSDQGDWFFLPESDPRVAGREVAARVDHYVLARAKPR